MQIATCTPVDFPADTLFFGRDSGLLCRGFQKAGYDCKVIMPGLSHGNDASDLVRTSMEQLVESEWWKSLGVDIVVLYAWGNPKYLLIAKAIRQAGIFLVQNMDTSGLWSPYSGLRDWGTVQIGMLNAAKSIRKRFKLVGVGIRDFFPFLFEQRRLAMIDESDMVACVSPEAAFHIQRWAKSLGSTRMRNKIQVIPHAVDFCMKLRGIEKENIVLAVGRWWQEDAGQKDPKLLMKCLNQFLKTNPDWRVMIIGRGAEMLLKEQGTEWIKYFARFETVESMSREELSVVYGRAKILFCPSSYESFHIASAEALCCGCSIVSTEHPLLSSMKWFASMNCGSLASKRNATALVQTLNHEVKAWEDGKRFPDKISRFWCDRLHADSVAKLVLQHHRQYILAGPN